MLYEIKSPILRNLHKTTALQPLIACVPLFIVILIQFSRESIMIDITVLVFGKQ